MNVYLEEDDQGPYADDKAQLVPLNETSDTQHLTFAQKLQLQMQKTERFVKSLYNDINKSKKHFKSMRKDIHIMKKQISNIEAYIHDIEKDKETGGAATSTLPVSMIPLPDGPPLRRQTQPRFVTVKREPRGSAAVASSSK